MGGSSGGIIVQNAVKAALSDPVVSGQLPPHIRDEVIAVCAKDCADWNPTDKIVAAHAIQWALSHLS